MTSGMSLKQWREQIGRHIIHLDFEPYGDAPFRAEVDPVFAHDGVRVTSAAISAGTTSRDKALVKLGTPARDLLIAKQPLFVRHRGAAGKPRPPSRPSPRFASPPRLRCCRCIIAIRL